MCKFLETPREKEKAIHMCKFRYTETKFHLGFQKNWKKKWNKNDMTKKWELLSALLGDENIINYWIELSYFITS